jgi:DNA-binding transcriptional MerR regulator
MQLVTTNEAARILGMKPQTLRLWRLRGTGPRYVRFGGPTGRAAYSVEELEAFVTERMRRSTSEETAVGA